MAEKLTKRVVDAAQPGTKDTILWDTEVRGFGLKVTPAGRKSYFLYYRTASGQQRRPTIGAHGSITVDEARQIARRWSAEVFAGRDVSTERQERRASSTVIDLCDRYIRDYARVHKKPRSIASDQSLINNHIIPLLGKAKISDVSRADIERAKLAIRDGKTARTREAKKRGRSIVRGGAGIANRAISLLSKMFACAEDWGLREGNPAQKIRKFAEKRKDRFLSEEEVARLLVTLKVAETRQSESAAAISAIKLLLFTGMRSGEVLGLRVRDIDIGRGILLLPDSKTGGRIVVLNEPSRETVERAMKGRELDEILFAGANGSPIALTRPWYRLREAAGIDKTANLHCLRHTFASHSVMNGLSLAQVGALLGHRSTQTTLRYADHAVDAIRGYAEIVGSALLKRKPA